MSGFYKPYPNEFYALNDLLPEDALADRPHLIINTIDFTNRCFNYNAIHAQRKQFSHEIYRNVITFLKENETLVREYIERFFPEIRRKQHLAFVDEISSKDATLSGSHDEEDLHYRLIELYHSFPNNPQKYLDGILGKVEGRLAVMGKPYRFVVIDLLGTEECRGRLPCAKMRFYGCENSESPLEIPLDLSGAFSQEIVADQEDLSLLDRCRHKDPAPHEADQRGAAVAEQEKDPSVFFFSYLYPLFFDPKFDGRRLREDITEFPFWSFVVLPVYSAELAAGGACGTVIGHMFLSFRDEKERKDYLERQEGAPNASWDTLAVLIARTLLEGRSHTVVEENTRLQDSLQDLLVNAGHVQDWERIMVFAAPADREPQYCLTRCPRRGKDRAGYTRDWVICEKERDCKECGGAGHEPVLAAFDGHCRENGRLRPHFPNTLCHQDKNYFIQRLSDILEPRILPSVGTADIDRYKEHILVFEFPDHTFYPAVAHSRQQAIRMLGEHYVKKLIPLFDRVLMKRKVLRHSVKSAVAAIISRNHSHHIGSHVTPRTDLEKVIDRLCQLGYRETPFERKARIAGVLKSRLDRYIQKKADFLSEIVTEPLTTTRSMGFFNEVILPFIENSLLLDNIGANEGVHYRKDRWNENRLRLHAYDGGRELKAEISGGAACGCNSHCQATDYPYSGHCRCNPRDPDPRQVNPYPLQVMAPELNDISLAFPGPLGEFALYAFLENFIRNAVKHNQEAFREDPELNLDVHIELSELAEHESERHDFFKLRIWEGITRPSRDLLDRLQGYIDNPVIDRYGGPRKGGWGIAEMTIMANLLRGSDDFLTMGSALTIHGGDRLVYEFKVMKPKELAVVSRSFDCGESHLRKGIRGFKSLDEFVEGQKGAVSPAAFNFVILDRDTDGDKAGFAPFLPNRVLIHRDLSIALPGALTIDDRFMASLRGSEPDDMIACVWQRWVNGLPLLSEDEQLGRVALFLGQDEKTPSTENWKICAAQQETRDNRPRASIIFLGASRNKIFPAVPPGEKVAVFDRHFEGYPTLPKDAQIVFHEAFDKNSLDFIPIWSARPSDLMISRLSESVMMRVLVIDERIAEVARRELFPDERKKPLKLYHSKHRIEVCRWANIYLATHLKIDDDAVKPLHQDIGNDFPQVLIETTLGTSAGTSLDAFQVSWISGERDGAFTKQKISPHIVIVHQGVLETFFGKKITGADNGSFVDGLGSFLRALKDYIPFVFIDSGRGIPANLPPDVRFVPFSLIQEYFMRESISKFSLIDTLMGLMRRGGR